MTNTNSTNNQTVKRRLVDREVITSASYMISELQTNERYLEDLQDVLLGYDYRTPVEEYIYCMDLDECVEYLESEPSEGETLEDLRKAVWEYVEKYDEVESFAYVNDIEPHMIEALEHYIVTRWFANKLEEKGEMIIKDFMGFDIWGRQCSGQAILLDSVISEIASDMLILEGQENHKHWIEI